MIYIYFDRWENELRRINTRSVQRNRTMENLNSDDDDGWLTKQENTWAYRQQ